MHMKTKKTFVAPRVIETEGVSLEKDMLVGQSAELSIIAAGQNYFEWNTDQIEGLYTEGDWTLTD